MMPRAALLMMLPLAFAPVGLQDCEVEEPPVNCDLVQVSLLADGTLTVINGNEQDVVAAISIESYQCTNQGCYFTGEYEGEVLPVGQARTFIADQMSDFCTDEFCCDTGYTGNATALIDIPEGMCGIAAAAAKPTCGAEESLEIERW